MSSPDNIDFGKLNAFLLVHFSDKKENKEALIAKTLKNFIYLRDHILNQEVISFDQIFLYISKSLLSKLLGYQTTTPIFDKIKNPHLFRIEEVILFSDYLNLPSVIVFKLFITK